MILHSELLLETPDDLLDVHRFGQERESADMPLMGLHFFAPYGCGQKDNGHMAQKRAGLEVCGQRTAVKFRHHHVHQHQVGLELDCDL